MIDAQSTINKSYKVATTDKDKMVQSIFAAVDVPRSCVLRRSSQCQTLEYERDGSFRIHTNVTSERNSAVQDVWLCNAVKHRRSCFAMHAMQEQDIWNAMQD